MSDANASTTAPVAVRCARCQSALGDAALRVLGVTMPPWPGENEAIAVTGPWTPT